MIFIQIFVHILIFIQLLIHHVHVDLLFICFWCRRSQVVSIVSVLSAEHVFMAKRPSHLNGSADGGGGGDGDSERDFLMRRAKFESPHGDLPTYFNIFQQFCKMNQPDGQKKVGSFFTFMFFNLFRSFITKFLLLKVSLKSCESFEQLDELIFLQNLFVISNHSSLVPTSKLREEDIGKVWVNLLFYPSRFIISNSFPRIIHRFFSFQLFAIFWKKFKIQLLNELSFCFPTSQFCEENGINHRALIYAVQVRKQLLDLSKTHDYRPQADNSEENVLRAIAEGLFMNCAEKQADGSYTIVSPHFFHLLSPRVQPSPLMSFP